MNRRELLKLSLLSPLAGLLKKKEPKKNIQEYPLGTRRENGDIYAKWGKPLTPTTGTSGGEVYFESFDHDRLIDPTSHWAKEELKNVRNWVDEAIIKAMT